MEIQSTSLARNALLNLLGQLVPALMGAATIPFFVRGLGTEGFGLLSLGWVILSYFTMFDLGLGRATAKYVAQTLGEGTGEQIRQLVWTALTIQAILGFLGALLLFVLTPTLVAQVFKISSQLIREARISFYLLALAVPVALLSGPLSGVLEATQRFDLLNAVRVSSSALTFLLPLAGLSLSLRLSGVVALLLAARVIAFAILAALTLRVAPELKRYACSCSRLSQLLSFGSWVMIANVAWPLLFYLDRFLISWLLGVEQFAYYQIAHQVINVAQLPALGVAGAMFPVVSTAEGKGRMDDIRRLYHGSLKVVVLIMAPVYFGLGVLSESVLSLWIGDDAAVRTAGVLRVLAYGGLAVSVLQIPYTVLHAVGRADWTAKMYLVQMCFYPGLLWFLIGKWGLVGAGAGWSVRAWFFGIALLLCCGELLGGGRGRAGGRMSGGGGVGEEEGRCRVREGSCGDAVEKGTGHNEVSGGTLERCGNARAVYRPPRKP